MTELHGRVRDTYRQFHPAYGIESGICCCGTLLTDKTRIAAGIGPVCAKKCGLLTWTAKAA